MNSDSLLTKKYSAIPSTLWPYYEDLVIKRPHHPIVKAIQNQGKDKTWSGINRLFEITSQNTGLPSDRLLQDMGFDRSNLDDNHLQSIFGVMRTVNLLVQIGFTKLRPLPPNKSRRESDLRGEFNRTMFAIEVFRSNEVAYRFPNHNSPTQNLQSSLLSKIAELGWPPT